MNNEEKNLTPENEGSEEVKVTAEPKKGISGGALIGIIAAAVVVVVAVILLIVLLPGNKGTGDGGNDGGNDGGASDGGNVDNQPETDDTYSVTVVDQDGNPVKGALVYFYSAGGGLDVPFPTNKDGVASYKTDKGVANVALFTLPAGYESSELNKKQNLDSDNKLTITVTKKAEENTGVSYTIRVVDQNGDAVVGATVQMCSDSGCFPFNPTDANGESVSIKDADNFKAQIVSLPDGYTDITNGEYQQFSGDAEGGFTVTIVVTKN